MTKKTNTMVKVAIMSAVAFVVMLIETPPLFSTFLRMDFSDIVAVIAGFALGPLAGVAVQLIKNVLHLMMSTTSGVGELGNFIVGGAFVFVAGHIYHKNKTRKQALIALLAASLTMVAVAILANVFLLLPLYAGVLGFKTEVIIELTAKVNPLVSDVTSFALFAIAPFNLIKALLVSFVTFIIYKKISKYL
ncbi:MAG: ECF transporter S component [Clostridiales bacterium]|nr:MAG: ECF transporter S component [Clostridiales bacterium]